MKKHYILIEVREPEEADTRRPGYTKAGDIRKELIRFCTARGINAAHCLVREDRPFIYGTGERTPYAETAALFREAMGPEWRRLQERKADDAAWWSAR